MTGGSQHACAAPTHSASMHKTDKNVHWSTPVPDTQDLTECRQCRRRLPWTEMLTSHARHGDHVTQPTCLACNRAYQRAYYARLAAERSTMAIRRRRRA